MTRRPSRVISALAVNPQKNVSSVEFEVSDPGLKKLVEKPVVGRAYRNYMKKMVKLGLAKTEGFGIWRSYEIIF